MIALYLLTLGVSAGLTGLYTHHVLAQFGFVPAFGAGAWLALGMAFTYAATQLVYVFLVQVYKPTRDAPFYLIENLSHGATVLFLPYILGMNLAMPHPFLERVEPLVYAGAFAAIHTLLKFASFYAATRGIPGPRMRAFAWAVAAAVCALIGIAGLARWASLIEGLRPVVAEDVRLSRVGDQYAEARPVDEGAMAEYDLSEAPGRAITLLWAQDPERDPAGSVERIHVTCVFTGGKTARHTQEIQLRRGQWTVMHLTADRIPAGAKTCQVIWNQGAVPSWQRFTTVSPVVTSSRRLLLAGPFHAEQRRENTGPNLVILVLDGVSAHRGNTFARTGQALPALDRLGASAAVFTNAYTPAPESAAAAMSILTGLPPLRHGYLGTRQGPLPRDCRTLPERLRDRGYLTAAFTEAEGDPQDGFGVRSDFSRGFDLYDVGAPQAEIGAELQIAGVDRGAAPPRDTLGRALDWVAANRDSKHAVFVRIRDLLASEPAPAPAADAFTARKNAPSPDRPLNTFIRGVRADANTCLVVAASSGGRPEELAGMAPADRLREPYLQVPLVLYAPGVAPQKRSRILSLEDVTLMLVKLTGGEEPFPKLEEDPKGGTPPVMGEAVSLCGEPLALSLRTDKWRLVWKTDVTTASVSTSGGVPSGGSLALYDVDAWRRSRTASDQSSRYRTLTGRFREYLVTYIDAMGESTG